MYGRIKCSEFSSSILYRTTVMTSLWKDYVFTLVLVQYNHTTHSSLWKDYAVTLVLVHTSFGVLNVEHCCGAGAGHLATEAVLLLQSKLFRVMCGVTKILQEL